MMPQCSKKAIAFGGCSFTWGQGLYHYSDLPNVVNVEEGVYHDHLVSFCQREFAALHRYPRLVANYYETCDLVQPYNGGSNTDAIRYWESRILYHEQLNIHGKHLTKEQMVKPEEVQLFVFQFTQPHREPNFELLDENNNAYMHYSAMEQGRVFEEYMAKKGFSNISEYEQYYRKICAESIKTFLQKLEKHGIRTMLYTWPNENVYHILQDEWLKDRYMRISYNGKTYDSQSELMQDVKQLTIKYDTEYFGEATPTDHHPSLKCHKVIANNIINYITEKGLMNK